MEHGDVGVLLLGGALLLLPEDARVHICQGQVARVGDPARLLVLKIFHQPDDARSLFGVFPLLGSTLLTGLPVLPTDHLDVLQAYPELRGWLGGRGRLALNLKVRVVCSVVRIGSILVAHMGSTYACHIGLALFQHRDGGDAPGGGPPDGNGRDVPLVLPNAAPVVAPRLGCRLHRRFLHDLEALNR